MGGTDMNPILLIIVAAVVGITSVFFFAVAIDFFVFYMMQKFQEEAEAEINELRKKKNEKYLDEYKAAGKSIY
jgi:uncharacterized membrane protein (DUF106 family)